MWELFKEFVRWFRDFQTIWLVLLAVFVFYMLVINARRGGTHRRPTDPTLGELIWVDEGRHTKPFFNHKFKVLGKPDAIYDKDGRVTTVEFKSRRGPVFDSDRVQALTAALAARADGFNVHETVVKTKTVEESFKLPKDDLALYQMVQPYAETVRNIKRGGTAKALPSKAKCSSCAYRSGCADRAV